MSFAALICFLMLGGIIYFIGMFSGAAMMEKSNEMVIEELQKGAQQQQRLRRIRFQERHLKGEA